MRRIQLYIEDELDHALDAEAARIGVSRSAVMRDAVRSWLADHVEAGPDPLDDIIGSVDMDATEDLDAVLYDQ